MKKSQLRNKRFSLIFLVLGMIFLAAGWATDQTAFSWVAVALVLLSLLLSGRWLRPRK